MLGLAEVLELCKPQVRRVIGWSNLIGLKVSLKSEASPATDAGLCFGIVVMTWLDCGLQRLYSHFSHGKTLRLCEANRESDAVRRERVGYENMQFIRAAPQFLQVQLGGETLVVVALRF